MSNIKAAFDHGKAFIPFVTCGDPDLETTGAIVRAAVLAHGGSCTAENIPGGVRFQVRLPALQSER